MARESADRADLLVVGGGPAGASAAIRAREAGLRVLVLEAARFPRHHVGESLVMLWPVLERLGVADEMDATFLHKSGSCRVWGRQAELRWTRFEASAGARGYSLQVERSRFDEILLRRAAAVGAEVREQCRVEGILWQGERAVGVRYRDARGVRREARAGWLVDASGRCGLVARELRLRRVDTFYPDLSLYGYFRDARRFPGHREGSLLIEAVPQGWLWFIPLHTGETSVGLVCDRSGRGELREAGPSRHLAGAIGGSQVVRAMLETATLSRGAFATASYGYDSARYAGPGWLLAGDAGSFVDPMWATGVANALTDGTLAAAVVEAVLTRRVDEAEALAYHDRELGTRARFVLPLVRFVYRVNRVHARHPFWRARAGGAGRLRPAPARMMRQLAKDVSRRYFRDAFRGMGVDDRILAPLDRQLRRTDGRDARVAPLLADLDAWRPALRRGVTLRASLGLDDRYRLVRGLAADNDGVVEFTADPRAGEALRAVDGRRSARQIVDSVVASAPPGLRVRTRFALLATLVDAHQRGMFRDA